MKDARVNFKFKLISKLATLFIPLDSSNIPIIQVLSSSGKAMSETITVGTHENITVYEKIYASVFKVP